MIDTTISNLLQYAKENLNLDERDENTVRNRLLEIVRLENVECVPATQHFSAPDVLLQQVVDYCLQAGVISDGQQETLCDKIMSTLSMSARQVEQIFQDKLRRDSKDATNWLFDYCVKNGYVRLSQLQKNIRFESCGLVVTINKAKPEFRNPKQAAFGNAVSGGYPKCVICRENEGYAPRNKRTLVTVSVTLDGQPFFWQYSPYGYFRQHGIAVNCQHVPMYVDKSTFRKLMDFVDVFPHYFIGCNAPLERIGGSVLSHDHFQGGGEILPLHNAPVKTFFRDIAHPDVEMGIVDWPGTVVRVSSKNKNALCDVCDKIRVAWESFNDAKAGIVAADEQGKHNAISPTVLKRADVYEMNIILRSNVTSDAYPDGVFHAHPQYHAIKKESIGLIEAQGLFILPGRLEGELQRIVECVKAGKLDDDLQQFAFLYENLQKSDAKNLQQEVQRQLGEICWKILQNTAVFKTPQQTEAFLSGVGFTKK